MLPISTTRYYLVLNFDLVSSLADVFVPDLRMRSDERAKQIGAFCGFQVNHLNAPVAQPTTTAPIRNWTINPLQYQHGAKVVTIIVS
jgi:hypothetical protein